MSEMLMHAKFYKSLGFAPIPLIDSNDPDTDRHPMFKGWKKYQTELPTDDDLTKWFSNGHTNIGLVMQLTKFAVDIDGSDSEALLTNAGITLPEGAPRSRTGGGGYHVLMSSPVPLTDHVAILGTKGSHQQIDIKADGYIVVPPSNHPSGHQYEWIIRPTATLPEAPANLISLIQNAKAHKPKLKKDAIAKALGGMEQGTRDETCARLAGVFISSGLPIEIVKAQLYLWADKCSAMPNVDPYTHAEVDKTVDSVYARDAKRPFQCLGYTDGTYYYLPNTTRQVVAIRASDHGQSTLITLAPLSYWKEKFSDDKGNIKWLAATDRTLRNCEGSGVYDDSRIRGRGAWYDKGEVVLHLGDTIIRNGIQTPIALAQHSQYIYQAAPPLALDLSKALEPSESIKLMDVASLCPIKSDTEKKYLAGWLMLATICGALDWRPHIWLTGTKSSGKSWIIKNLMMPILHPLGIQVQGETTEAGLRQRLVTDARSVVFDEFESENERSEKRAEAVIELARQASSDSAGTTLKGTISGKAREFRIRSMFCYSSIGVHVSRAADTSRTTLIHLAYDKDAERFSRLARMTQEALTPEFCAGIRSRAITLIPTIRANAKTLSKAVAKAIHSQRLGDQIGTLLAGYLAVMSDSTITPQDAETMVSGIELSEAAAIESQKDEMDCLLHLLQHKERIQLDHGYQERTIAEMLHDIGEGSILERLYAEHLARIGIRLENDHIMLANSSKAIPDILSGTPWATSWRVILRRLTGVTVPDCSYWFAGIKSRVLAIPAQTIN